MKRTEAPIYTLYNDKKEHYKEGGLYGSDSKYFLLYEFIINDFNDKIKELDFHFANFNILFFARDEYNEHEAHKELGTIIGSWPHQLPRHDSPIIKSVTIIPPKDPFLLLQINDMPWKQKLNETNPEITFEKRILLKVLYKNKIGWLPGGYIKEQRKDEENIKTYQNLIMKFD